MIASKDALSQTIKTLLIATSLLEQTITAQQSSLFQLVTGNGICIYHSWRNTMLTLFSNQL